MTQPQGTPKKFFALQYIIFPRTAAGSVRIMRGNLSIPHRSRADTDSSRAKQISSSTSVWYSAWKPRAILMVDTSISVCGAGHPGPV
jgi:hypothetical protein